ncbi:hypothetical protein [Mycobacteroides abscessus]|uniref:hypothetical protein n=1 Tax=Mycobacteroides abscessus TaxID=36809 RepID=UPI0005E12BD3|nr:hypothetical protein [Mycobacteroides abscessus]CPR79498.1 Uncharacterised protein [Mycobacteroides abscessus]CPR88612.1 Uncharacterised protein [Mycobacteroides abscessus]CPS43554.1 Uncharacterised protein [Mycobacteroides abscessus]CPV03341.1 Uncharacterised protein [Mycobacteroides abscessus]
MSPAQAARQAANEMRQRVDHAIATGGTAAFGDWAYPAFERFAELLETPSTTTEKE